MRELGSNPDTVEVFGGMYDGAVGRVLSRVEEDGKIITTVELPDGTVISLASAAPGSPELPRETGS